MAFNSYVKCNNILQVKVYDTQDPTQFSWVSLPDPQTMQIETYDLDSEDGAGRDQSGLMFRDRRAVKEKLTCTFPPMWAGDYKELLSLLKDTFFEMKYFSPYYGGTRTATMYVGNRTAPWYYLHDPNNRNQSWMQASSMNFIER